MPQMLPSYWVVVFLVSLFLFIMLVSMLSFGVFPFKVDNKRKVKKNSSSWL